MHARLPPTAGSYTSFDDTAGSGKPRGIVNRVGVDHHEAKSQWFHTEYANRCQHTPFQPRLGLFSVAWLKLHGGGSTYGVDWHDLVYGSDAKSLCGGGGGVMERCQVYS